MLTSGLGARLDQKKLRADQAGDRVEDRSQEILVLCRLICPLLESVQHEHRRVTYAINAEFGLARSVPISSFDDGVRVLRGSIDCLTEVSPLGSLEVVLHGSSSRSPSRTPRAGPWAYNCNMVPWLLTH